ncbi:MAG: hypothetical protein ABL933_05575 [Methyloglobulus sp.]|nr:hypothetical protein [Methyloglobulus sp.]
MKSVSAAIIVGLILLYFVNAALKVDLFNWEMLIHSGIRFFSGFIILGIGCFYAHKIKLTASLYFVLALILADDIMDYYRDTTRFSVEMMLHGIFMLAWGSVIGYFAMKIAKDRRV